MIFAELVAEELHRLAIEKALHSIQVHASDKEVKFLKAIFIKAGNFVLQLVEQLFAEFFIKVFGAERLVSELESVVCNENNGNCILELAGTRSDSHV
jgi:hypothetical protein